MRNACSKVMRLGRATVFLFGLVATLGIVVGVSTTALAAVPGDPFKLGKLNAVDRVTSLVGNASGPLLKITNDGGGPAVALESADGEPPLRVNAQSGKAANLDADKLDGQDASAFLPAGDKAADAERLDGTDSDGFMRYFSRYVTARSAEDSAERKAAVAECPEGEVALSGRVTVGTNRATHELTPVPPVALDSVGPEGKRWSATARETEPYDDTWHLRVTAYCVRTPPEIVPAGQ